MLFYSFIKTLIDSDKFDKKKQRGSYGLSAILDNHA